MLLEGVHISFLAVILAALAYYLLGALWYSPKCFGSLWMKHEGPECAHCEMGYCKVSAYVGELVLDLISAYVLAVFISLSGAMDWKHGLYVGLWVWIGFLVPTHLSGVIWGKRSFKCFLIHSAFLLFAFLIMGSIIGALAGKVN